MTPYQRQEAIDLLCELTDAGQDEIESCDDFGLEAWLYELGFDWHANAGMFGAWKPYNPPPVFAPVAVHVESADFGPLFSEEVKR